MLGALAGRGLAPGVWTPPSDSGADESLLKMIPSTGERHEGVLRGEPIDFVQLTRNILDRVAESRLRPMVADRGIAVITNGPFRQKGWITRFQRYTRPGRAGETRCENWPQFPLKSSCRIPRQPARFPLLRGSNTCGRIGRLCMDRRRARRCAAV